MNDKNLIKALKKLRQIKPSKDWVVSLKKDIMGEQPKFGTQILSVFNAVPRTVSNHKLAYATVTAFMILIAMVGGLFLIPTSNNNKLEAELLVAAAQSRYSLEIANEKLAGLVQIVVGNEQTDAVASAVEEVNKSITKASETITGEMVSNPKALKEIVSAVRQIDLNKKNLETLGVIVDEDYQLNNVLAPLVQREIESLECSTLNENQERELKELKGLYEQGQYSQALEKILSITNLD